MSLRISVDEGHALEVLDMLCHGRPVRITPTRPVAEPRPELVAVAARRLATTCLRVLVESGRRERVVLRAGRRVRGRVWDAARTQGFRLRFTAATYELWVQTTQRWSEIARQAEVVEGEGSSRRARRQIRRIIKIADTDTGDWLVYALAYRNLGRMAMPAEIREDLGRRLCLGSPLAMLLSLDDFAGDDAAGAGPGVDVLLEEPAVVLLECLEDLLVEQWVGQITLSMHASPGETRAERLMAAGRVLERYVERLDAHGRLDLARPLCRALARLLSEAWAGPPTEVARRLAYDAGLSQRSQLDALRRGLARIVAIGGRLSALREMLAGERYGDPRYEEAQVYLEVHDTLLRPHLGRLDALARELTGRLG